MRRFLQARHAYLIGAVIALFGLALLSQPALAGFIQQGPKLVANDPAGSPQQGVSVAVSADGNTAILGGSGDNGGIGAAWVFTRSGGIWTQQGNKLVGSGAATNAATNQGSAVALSADGNTAVVGGPGYGAWVFTRSNGIWGQEQYIIAPSGGNGGGGRSVALSADGNTLLLGNGSTAGITGGGTWVFTRSNGVWTEEGFLFAHGEAFPGGQGWSVALSADGNTALVGDPYDGNLFPPCGQGYVQWGSVYVFTRSNEVWTQESVHFSGPSCGNSRFGWSVALSADGNTALIGAYADGSDANGAAWTFTRGSNGKWIGEPKLAGTTRGAELGFAVALSPDGNTALIGGPGDNSGAGAAWIFTSSNGVWRQQGQKLVGTGAVGNAGEGSSVALSGDGNTAIVGGPADNFGVGAAWTFAQFPPHDFNGDGYSDILWRHTSGAVAIWEMNGTQVIGDGILGIIDNNWRIVGTGDFNRDGKSDILWHHTSGAMAIWFMNGLTVLPPFGWLGVIPFTWSVVGTGDFNGDGYADILWRDTSGNLALWLMNGATVIQSGTLGNVPMSWSIVGTGDFNGDGQSDILWRDTSGNVAIWEMNGTTILNLSASYVGTVSTAWSIVGTGDFNGDGQSDILWRDTSGNVAIWEMNGTTILNLSASYVGTVSTAWSIVGTGDFNGDGQSDILWRDTSGNVAIWEMNGTTILNLSASYVGTVSTSWTIQGVNAD